ncbi:MAG: hypothetical protein KDE51_16285 [Anaerolineales bacterium]|nr:hypothetical protein [Anaerolineales bacterium]
MSIQLTVGILADEAQDDDHTFRAWITAQFTAVNKLLAAHQQPPHQEPSINISPFDLTLTSEMFPLHDLAEQIQNTSLLRFPHLLEQSGNAGFYLPRPLPTPLPIAAASDIMGTVIGSAVALQAECRLLAMVCNMYTEIEARPDLTPPTVANWADLVAQFDTNGRWTPAVSGCQKLYTAAQHALRTGCAIVIY